MVDRTDKTPILFGTFTATFTFALVVLSQVRENAVPDVSVLVSLLLLLVSVGLLLRLLATFRTTLTTGGLARAVGNQLREVIDVMYPARFDPARARRHARRDAGEAPGRAVVADPPCRRPGFSRHSTSRPRSGSRPAPGPRSGSSRPSAISSSAGPSSRRAPGPPPTRRSSAAGQDRPAPHAGAGPGLRNPAAGRHRAARAVARRERSHQRGAGTRPARRRPAAAGQAVARRWPPARGRRTGPGPLPGAEVGRVRGAGGRRDHRLRGRQHPGDPAAARAP